jgi:hypothetical protein
MDWALCPYRFFVVTQTCFYRDDHDTNDTNDGFTVGQRTRAVVLLGNLVRSL